MRSKSLNITPTGNLNISNIDKRMKLNNNISKLPRVQIKPLIGVYFLFWENNVVYIGQSTDIFRRVEDHKKDKTKIFDSFCFIKCKLNSLNELEKGYIKLYQPKYNENFRDKTIEVVGDVCSQEEMSGRTCVIKSNTMFLRVGDDVVKVNLIHKKGYVKKFQGYFGELHLNKTNGLYFGEILITNNKYFITYTGKGEYKVEPASTNLKP